MRTFGSQMPNPSIERTSRIKPREAAHFKRWASEAGYSAID